MTATAAGSPADIEIAAGNLSKGIWSCNPDYTVNGAVKHMGDTTSIRPPFATLSRALTMDSLQAPRRTRTPGNPWSRSERELVSTDRPSAKSCL